MTRKSVPKTVENLKTGDRGAYILEFKVEKPVELDVGRLGKHTLVPGYYYYVGSAMNGLRGRLRRHFSGVGKKFWHIDSLAGIVSPDRAWIVISDRKLEAEITMIAEAKCYVGIKGFGSSDSPNTSTHLFYSEKRRNFRKELEELGLCMMVD